MTSKSDTRRAILTHRLITDGENIPDDNDDIPSFLLDEDDAFVDILHKEDDTEEFA